LTKLQSGAGMQSKPLAAKVADIRPGIREDDGTGVFLRGAGQMAIVFAFGLFCGCLFTPRPTFAQGQPRVLGSPLIDNTNRSSGRGETLIYLRNESANQLPVFLSSGQVTISGSSKTSDAQISFAANSDTGPGAPAYEFNLAPQASATIRAIVTKAWDSPRLEAELLNGATRIGKIVVSTSTLNVALQEPNRDKAAMDLVDGVPARIVLKNDDAVAHSLFFRLIVGGRQIAGHPFELPPNGMSLLEFVPAIPIRSDPKSYIPAVLSRIQEIFKSEYKEGDVLLLYDGEAGSVVDSSPVKIINLKTSFSYFSPQWRSTLNYLLIVSILILGGIASLTVGHALPNMLQKLNIDEQLNGLARKISNLSSNIDSDLAVLMRLERSRMHDLLKSRATISPEFAAVLDQCKDGVAKLSCRVSLLQQMDIVIGRLSNLARAGAPPSQIDQVSWILGKSCETLKKTDAPDTDIQDVQKSILAAAVELDGVGRPNPVFGQALAARVHDVCTNVVLPMVNKRTFVRVNTAVPGPLSTLQAVPAATTEIDSSSYFSVDLALSKVQLIREYVEFAEGTTDPQTQVRLQQREVQLISHLNLQSWEELRAARLLVQEMKEHLYPDRPREALTASPPEASIHMEPAIAYEEELLDFSIRFANIAINTATARDEWCCRWSFGDGLEGTGWVVSHYFLLPRPPLLGKRAAKEFVVAASFCDSAGKLVNDTAGKAVALISEITVMPSRLRTLVGERSVVEVSRLSVALLIAVFGLVAGAKDQLLKLDVLPGLAAVFVAGYGVDTLKNLMSTGKSS
jgi:hypothetical protein